MYSDYTARQNKQISVGNRCVAAHIHIFFVQSESFRYDYFIKINERNLAIDNFWLEKSFNLKYLLEKEKLSR